MSALEARDRHLHRFPAGGELTLHTTHPDTGVTTTGATNGHKSLFFGVQVEHDLAGKHMRLDTARAGESTLLVNGKQKFQLSVLLRRIVDQSQCRSNGHTIVSTESGALGC